MGRRFLALLVLVGCAGSYVPEAADVDSVEAGLDGDDTGCHGVGIGGSPPQYVHSSCSAILPPMPGHTAAECSKAVCRSACTSCMHPATCSEAQTAAKAAARQLLVNADPLAVMCKWDQPVFYSCGNCLNGDC